MKKYPHGVQVATAALAQQMMKQLLLVLPAEPCGHAIIEHEEGEAGDATLARYTVTGAHWWLFNESGALVSTTDMQGRESVEAAIGETIGTLSGGERRD